MPRSFPFPKSCGDVATPHYTYGIAAGWQVTKIGGKLTQPRSILFDTAQNMIVLEVRYFGG